jgi:hypothetical protein
MNENVLSAHIGSNESKPFLVVKPLHLARAHTARSFPDLNAERASINRAAREEKNFGGPIPSEKASPGAGRDATQEQDHTTGHATPPKNLDVFLIPGGTYPQSWRATRHFCLVFPWFLPITPILPR